MIVQKQARIADFLKVVDNELSTTFHTMFVTSPFLGGTYRSDKLYHFFDDITKFLEPLNTIDVKPSSINLTISKIPYLKIRS